MGRAADRSKNQQEKKFVDSTSLSSDSDDDDDDDDDDMDADMDREETPDLYRNSSLGMYVSKSVNCA
jgi:E3 ubiquitin-protein ligase HUWE1